jgi:hypothetical protein
MARKKPAAKAGRKSKPRKAARKAGPKATKRKTAARSLGAEVSIGPTNDALDRVIGNLRSVSATAGESVQTELNAAIGSLESASSAFAVACRKARRIP